MRVMLTGSTGFVGSEVLRELQRRGHQVIAFVRQPKKLDDKGLQPERVVCGDLADTDGIERALADAEAVIHVAGCIAERYRGEFEDTNVHGTRNLCMSARRSGAELPLVHISSVAAVGPSVAGAVLDEHTPCNPISRYGRSKMASESVIGDGHRPAPAVVVRPPIVFGPGDPATLPIFQMARWGIAPLVGSADKPVSLCYNPDLARGIVDSLEFAKTHHGAETFCFTTTEQPRVRDLLRAVGECFGKRVRVLPIPAAVARFAALSAEQYARWSGTLSIFNTDKLTELQAPGWRFSGARARHVLGWQPRTSLPQALSQTAEWYRERGWL